MFSLIVSVKDKRTFNSVLLPSLNYLHEYLRNHQLPHIQLIPIYDGNKSITKNYNKGLEQSLWKIKFFIHEDVDIKDTQIPLFIKVYSLFNLFPDTGLIGLVGTTENSPGFWWNCSRNSIMGHVLCCNEYWKWDIDEIYRDVNVVDGMFMATNTDIKFSEDIDGFHLYDSDYSNTIRKAGLKVKVLTHLVDHRATYKDLSKVNIDYFNKKWNLFSNLVELKKLEAQHKEAYDEVITRNLYRIREEDLENKDVLDLGANNGCFTLLAKYYKAKKIIAVESNIATFEVLSKNTKDLDIVLINKAASSKSGERVTLGRQSDYSTIDGRCYVVPNSVGEIETISLNDLVKMFDGNIVLKIDVEGSEFDIIEGASIETLKRCSTILMEIHQDMGAVLGKTNIIEGLKTHLKNIGFTEVWKNEAYNVNLVRFDLIEN
jgi:FkbM family methyltransferase